MAGFIKGEIVVVPFPFSDLSSSKRRPALILADLSGDDIVLCQITSQSSADPNAIQLSTTDFQVGELPKLSYIRPLRIFTADKNIIIRRVGTVKSAYFEKVIDKLVAVLKS